MSPTRRIALVAGVFYLITFVSIPTLFLYGPSRRRTSSPAPARTRACCWAASSR
jgi:hypothetical protein